MENEEWNKVKLVHFGKVYYRNLVLGELGISIESGEKRFVSIKPSHKQFLHHANPKI